MRSGWILANSLRPERCYLHDSPLELEIDTHYHKIKQIIEEHQIERLVLDGLTTYQNAIGDQRIFREFVHGLMAFAKRRLITTFILYENPEVFGITRLMPDAAISSIVDNILLLSFVEIGNQVRRGLTVIKARGCAHDLVSREFTIGAGGTPAARFHHLKRHSPASPRAGVPVVSVYETMPTGYTYQRWMLAEVNAIGKAVAGKVSTQKL